MIQTISVALSGPAHSFLLFETARCDFGQEGFLLGSIHEYEKHSVTDDNEQQVHISRVITINSAIPCPILGYFYDNIGNIDETKMKTFLGSQACKVLAWYRYSSLPMDKLTFRERKIHIELANFFKIPQDLFSFCILTNALVDNDNTLKLQQIFFRLKNNKYEQLPIHIMNLQKNTSYKRNDYSTKSFQDLVNNLDMSPTREQGPFYMSELHKTIQERSKNIVKDLAAEEEKLHTLEQEVKKLLSDRRQKEVQAELEEEIEDDSSQSPCEILPFISRLNREKNTARRLQF